MQDNSAEKPSQPPKDGKKVKAQPGAEKQGISNHPYGEEKRRQAKVIAFPDRRAKSRGSNETQK